MKSRIDTLISLGLIAFTLTFGQTNSPKQLNDYLTNLPFPMPAMKEPQFPAHMENIVSYGAVADGHTLNTKAFAEAIAACAKAGGGTVIVPPGTWVTGPIRLERNINLHVEKGALVQFSKNINDFPFVAGPDGRGSRYTIAPPILAWRVKNVAITGEGIFDGAGEVWRYVRKEDQTEFQWKRLVASGGVVSADGEEWWPSQAAMDAEKYLKANAGKLTKEDYASTREYLRPDLVNFIQCTDVLLDGPTFENSPKFTVHPIQCENLIIRNIKVLAPWWAKNTDGIDPGFSRNVVIYNCMIDVGDDGICLKPSSLAGTQTPGPACRNIVVADCVVYHAHGGFVIGSESYGGVQNVSVKNCVFIGTDVGLRFKSVRGKGGVVEQVFIDGIQMRDILTDAILFDMYYAGGAPIVEAKRDLTIRKGEPMTERTPQFKDFFVKNIVCNGADRAVVLNGLPECSIKNMSLENISIESKRGAYIADADGVQLTNCRFVPQSGASFNLIQSKNVTINGGAYPASSDVFMNVFGEKSENIRVLGAECKRAKKVFELQGNAQAGAVVVK